MTKNLENLKFLLLKHLEKEQREKGIIMSIFERIYKDQKVKIEEITKKIAASRIVKAARQKLKLVTINNPIAKELCSITGTQAIYRRDFSKKLERNEIPNKLSNMYFYYCIFSSKILGDTRSGKNVPETFIKEIVGCVFVNTNFKSTNLSGIKFKNSKFLNIGIDTKGNKYFNYLKRSDLYRTIKENHNPRNELNLDNCNFTDSTFESCHFFNLTFDLATIIFGSKVITGTTTIILFPTFLECNFTDGIIINHPDRDSDEELISDTEDKYKLKYPRFITDGKAIENVEKNGEIKYTKKYIFEKPKLIFEKCKFDKIKFGKEKEYNFDNKELYKYLFKTCIFYKVNFYYDFKYNTFIDCIFDSCTFNECLFENIYFENCEFNNCTFDKLIGALRLCEFNSCKILNCTFTNSFFHNFLFPFFTIIITSSTIIEETKFIDSTFTGFKFNFDSKFVTQDSTTTIQQLSLKKNEFISCNMYGTIFDDCNLEGSNFAETTNSTNYFNWFGSIYLIQDSRPFIGRHVTSNFRKLCQSEDNFKVFQDDFQNTRHENKNRSNLPNFIKVEPYEYSAFNINVYSFLEDTTDIKPYDFFYIDNDKYYQIIPSTSMKNTNIKNCNFQGIEGFQHFNFTQIAKISTTSSDLTATNFTNVDLTNANFRGCNLIGTIFQVADVKGADFRECIVNNNTDFVNALNTELVLYQTANENGTRIIEGTKNIDTDEPFGFSELQQLANETHHRSDYFINNKEKFKELLTDMGVPVDNNIKKISQEDIMNFFIAQEIDVDIVDKRLPNVNNIYEFLFELIKISRKILASNRDLPNNKDKDYIRDNFANVVCEFISSRLDYNEAEREKLLHDLNICINQEFINILTSFKGDYIRRDTTRITKWCWLELITLSLIFLLGNTKTYISNFRLYYFDDVFNAHNPGSMSCVLGIVERWILTHSQVSQAYLILLKNSEVKDAKLSDKFIETFFDQDSKVKYHHKYKYNRLINIIVPPTGSILPESKEQDLGIDFDFNITAAMRKNCGQFIKKELQNGTIQTFDDLSKKYIEIMFIIILQENKIEKKDVIYNLKEGPVYKRELFAEKLKEIKEHIKIKEIPQLKEAIIGLCSSDLTLDDIKEFFAGGKNKKKNDTKKKYKQGKGIFAKSLSERKLKKSLKSKSSRAKSADNLKVLRKKDLKKKLFTLEKKLIANMLKLTTEEFNSLFNFSYNINSYKNLQDIFETLISSDKKTKETTKKETIKKETTKKRETTKTKETKKELSSRIKQRKLTRRRSRKQFIVIPERQVEKINTGMPLYYLKNMNILYKHYREIIEKKYKKIHDKYQNNIYRNIKDKQHLGSIQKIVKQQEKLKKYKECISKLLGFNIHVCEEIFFKIANNEYLKSFDNVKKMIDLLKNKDSKNLLEIFKTEFKELHNIKYDNFYKKQPDVDSFKIKLLEIFKEKISKSTRQIKAATPTKQATTKLATKPTTTRRVATKQRTTKFLEIVPKKGGNNLRKIKSFTLKKRSNKEEKLERNAYSENDKGNLICNNANNDCPICIDNLVGKNNILSKKPIKQCKSCKNCFHTDCLNKLFNANINICPLCRNDISYLDDKMNLRNADNLNTEDTQNRRNIRQPSIAPIIKLDIVFIIVFGLPIYGATHGLIDPITTNNIIQGVISLAASSGIVIPMFHSSQ